MNRRLLVLSLSLVFASLAADARAAGEAVRELGQPSFRGFIPNRVDARGLAQPWGVAVDTSRNPNGLWVVDAGNNRVLGWRDVTALSNGAPADMVIGQPNARSSGCNTGGVSAASLCFVESFYSFAYDPGVAVDAEGNLYVADQRNARVLGYRRPFETDRVADLVIGQAGFDQAEPAPGASGASRLFDPHGLAADAQGNLYISDRVRVLELDRPFATDAVADRVFGKPSFDSTSGGSPDPNADIGYTDGVAVDAQGRLYVADSWADRVMVWKQPLARQGAADLVFSQGGTCDFSGANGCSTPKGIAVAPNGDVWVGSHEKGRLFGYRSPLRDGDTQPDRVIVAATSAIAYDPTTPRDGRPETAGGGLAIDSRGTLWLADQNRVIGFLDPWNGDGRADRLLGQVRPDQLEANLVDLDGLEAPDGIVFDTSAHPPHLYVVDAFNNRVLGWADAEGFANGQPADLVIGQPDRWSSGCNTGGRSRASLCLGESFNGIAVDSRGTVWVSDSGNSRVLGLRSPFTTDAVADVVLGGIGCASGLRGMCIPGGLAVDKTGNLYVADIRNNRILEFNQPARRDAVADRVLGAHNLRQYGCDAATCFSEESSTHPALHIFGGALAVDAGGRLLVGTGNAVYVFERPLRPGARSHKLIDLSTIDHSPYGPYGLATDSAERIYLSGESHVYRFSRNGSGPSLQLGEPCYSRYFPRLSEGLERSSLCHPTGLAVGPENELFVSDTGNNRMMVFENP